MLTVMTLEDALALREAVAGSKVTAPARLVNEVIDYISTNVPTDEDGTFLYFVVDLLAQTNDEGEAVVKSAAAKNTYTKWIKSADIPAGMVLTVSTKIGRTRDAKGTPLSIVCNLAGKPTSEDEVKAYREAFEAFQLAQLEEKEAA